MAEEIILTPEQAQAYWKKNVNLITVLLIIWALVSIVAAILLAQPLYTIKLGQLPLSFWFAQQGSIIVFVLLIFTYCWMMDRIDREFGLAD
jgi:putative solute:sodium symporter small subunit